MSPQSPAAVHDWWSTSAEGPAPAHGSCPAKSCPAQQPNGDLSRTHMHTHTHREREDRAVNIECRRSGCYPAKPSSRNEE